MDRTEAIEHLKFILNTCDVQDEEAVEMAIKSLEETHTLNDNTLTIKVSEEDIDNVKRVMLDCAPWCRTFYEDAKDINVPSKSALDHIHNVVAENAFNKGYDAGYEEGYERGKADATISASTLAKRLTAKFDDVLSVADVLEELEMVEKGEGYEQGKAAAAFKWTPVTEELPKEKGEYLVTYHPCYWDNVEDDVKEVGIDSFRGKESWAKSKYQKVIAWAEKPEPWEGE